VSDHELPNDLNVLDRTDLDDARTSRDDRLTALFRRWPALSRREQRELRVTWRERVRLARHVGRTKPRSN
jgi:hypothetical protein